MGNSWLKFNSQRFRWLVQIAFFILTVFIGWRFYLFVRYCESGGTGTSISRPPGVEAFLPINALVSIKYFFLTGKIDQTHPAGFVIFCAILLTALVFRRGFCSWMCPVGTMSEWLWRLYDSLAMDFHIQPTGSISKRLRKKSFEIGFGKNIRIPRIADIVLRSCKYLLLAFFMHILFLMDKDGSSLTTVLQDAAPEKFYQNVPYFRVAAVKMMMFFTNISLLPLVIIIVLIIGSFINKNFWCRYFCPYGALIGILGWISPFRIARDKDLCIDCGKCTKACPVYITVENKDTISNPECLVCYDCVQACPKQGALDLKLIGLRAKIHYLVYAAILLGSFGILTTAGRLTGNWHTSITVPEFVHRIQHIHDPLYDHKQGKFATEKGTFEIK